MGHLSPLGNLCRCQLNFERVNWHWFTALTPHLRFEYNNFAQTQFTVVTHLLRTKWSFPTALGTSCQGPYCIHCSSTTPGQASFLRAQQVCSLLLPVCAYFPEESKLSAQLVEQSFVFWFYQPCFYCPLPLLSWYHRSQAPPSSGEPNTCTPPQKLWV